MSERTRSSLGSSGRIGSGCSRWSPVPQPQEPTQNGWRSPMRAAGRKLAKRVIAKLDESAGRPVTAPIAIGGRAVNPAIAELASAPPGSAGGPSCVTASQPSRRSPQRDLQPPAPTLAPGAPSTTASSPRSSPGGIVESGASSPATTVSSASTSMMPAPRTARSRRGRTRSFGPSRPTGSARPQAPGLHAWCRATGQPPETAAATSRSTPAAGTSP